MIYLLLGAALLIGVYALARGFATADARKLAQVLRWTAVGLVVGVCGLLIVTGRLGTLLYVVPLLLPLLMRWRYALGRAKAALGPSPGQQSKVETAWLRMWLDHDTGQMDGEVLQGALAGRTLSTLAPEELLDLLDTLNAADPQSAQLVEAFLDRAAPDWRDPAAAGAGPEQPPPPPPRQPPPKGGMSVDEARDVLGVGPEADEAAIKEAHRRLMLRNHPDQGGSTWVAARINQAKDILLGRRRPGT